MGLNGGVFHFFEKGRLHTEEEQNIKNQNSLNGISGPLIVLSQPKETVSKCIRTNAWCLQAFFLCFSQN